MQHRNPYPVHRRLPLGLLAAVVLAALLLMGGVLAWLAWKFETLAPAFQHFLLNWLFLLPPVLISGGALYLGALGWRWLGLSSSIAELLAIMKTMAEKRQGARATTLHYEVNTEQTAPPVIEGEVIPQLPLGIPTFGQLLDQGKIGPGRPLILGYHAATGQAVEGGWDSLYSCGIGALQGAGKSWLAAFLLAQSAAQGGRLIVCDLHYGSDESLGTRLEALAPAFMCDIASTPDAILSALKLANDKLQQRIAGRGGTWEILVAIDEYTSLLRTKVGAVLPDFLEDVTEQGRKYHVNALLSAQGWTKDTAGVVRNRLTSHYVMRQRPDEARYQLGLRGGQMPLDLIELPPATAYLLDTRGNLRKVQIPQMTSQDLARVGALIDRPAAAIGSPFGFGVASTLASTARAVEASGKPDGSLMEAKSNQASTPAGSAGSLSPEAARAAALFLAGNEMPAIVKELRGIDAGKGGRNYQTAAKEISDLLRQAMKGA